MLLIDGDIIAYRCGWASNDDNVDTAIDTTKQFIYDLVTTAYANLDDSVAEEDMDFVIYLTGRGNFRHDVAVTEPYKGNRADKPKPIFLNDIRQHLVNDWDAVVVEGEEADDRIAIEMTNNPDAVAVSIDKDFLQVPGKHYDMVKHELTVIEPMEGLRRFYAQILTGDRVDNIIGIKGVGPVKSRKLIDKCKTEQEMYAVCVKEYEKADMDEARVIENARLLYLRRRDGELWTPPTQENTSEE